jgi:hypothetical protein
MDDSLAHRLMQFLSQRRAGPVVPMSSGGVPLAHGAPFDAESADYDMASALKAGLAADATGHWPSRDPSTGMLLKGRAHPTWHKTEQGEMDAGYEITKRDGRYFSGPRQRPVNGAPVHNSSPGGRIHPGLLGNVRG